MGKQFFFYMGLMSIAMVGFQNCGVAPEGFESFRSSESIIITADKNASTKVVFGNAESLLAEVQPDGSVQLTWPVVSSSEGYSIYKNDNWLAGSSNRKAIENKISLVDSDIDLENTYAYRVVSRETHSRTGKRINTVIGEVMVLKEDSAVVPLEISVSINPSNNVLVEWDKVEGADAYRVYRDNSLLSEILETEVFSSPLKYEDISLDESGEYTYRVEFVKGIDTSNQASLPVAEQVVSFDILPFEEEAGDCTKELVAKLQSDLTVRLCWPMVSGSDGYSIYKNEKWIMGSSNGAAEGGVIAISDTEIGGNESSVYKVISRATNSKTGRRKNTTVGEVQFSPNGEDEHDVIITEDDPEPEADDDTSTGTALQNSKDYCIDGKTVSNTESNKKLAFPCAKGYGRFSTGGNVPGAKHYTINDKGTAAKKGDGKITVKEFVEAVGDVNRGCRYADVSVGGFADWGMEVLSTTRSDQGCFTLAFHTAPGNGLLMGYQRWEFKGTANNIVLHFPKMIGNEPTTLGGAETSSAIRIVSSGSVNDFIVRNATVRNFADDQVILAYNNATATVSHSDLTIQDSAVYEGDAWSKHSESQALMEKKGYAKSDWYYHATGISCSGHSANKVKPERCSVIKNFLAHNSIRTPRFNGGTGEVIDNIVYNWRLRAMDIHSLKNPKGWSYIEGNFYKAGPSSEGNIPFRILPNDRPYYVKNNIWEDQSGNQKNSVEYSGSPTTPRTTASTGLPNLSCVGAWLPARDSETTRVINEYKNGTGEVGIGSVPQDPKCPSKHCAVGESDRVTTADYPDTKRPNDFDTDGDGIPNSWEIEQGLDPNNPADGGQFGPGETYNNWHKYIHSIIASKGRVKNC